MTRVGCNPASATTWRASSLLLRGRRALEDLEPARRRQRGPHGGEQQRPPRRASPRATRRAPTPEHATAGRRRGRRLGADLGAGSRSCARLWRRAGSVVRDGDRVARDELGFDGRQFGDRRRPTGRACRRRCVAAHHDVARAVLRLRGHLLASGVRDIRFARPPTGERSASEDAACGSHAPSVAHPTRVRHGTVPGVQARSARGALRAWRPRGALRRRRSRRRPGRTAAPADQESERERDEEHQHAVDRGRQAHLDAADDGLGDDDREGRVVDADLERARDRLAAVDPEQPRHEVADAERDHAEQHGDAGEAAGVLDEQVEVRDDRAGDDDHEDHDRRDAHGLVHAVGERRTSTSARACRARPAAARSRTPR